MKARPLWPIAAVLLFASLASAALTVTVVPSSAPNGFTNPGTWSTYAARALTSLENGGGTIGDRATDPAAYQPLTTRVAPTDVVVSNFASWRSSASPETYFAAEHGNRLHFGLHVLGNGTQFRLVDISGTINSDDVVDAFATNFSFAGQSFNSNRRGISYGADGVKGTADDIIYTSGPGTPLLDEFVYPGLGQALDATFEDGTTNQEKLDSVQEWIAVAGLTQVWADYTIANPGRTEPLGFGESRIAVRNAKGGGFIQPAARSVPEPASLALFAIASLPMLRRRREKNI